MAILWWLGILTWYGIGLIAYRICSMPLRPLDKADVVFGYVAALAGPLVFPIALWIYLIGLFGNWLADETKRLPNIFEPKE